MNITIEPGQYVIAVSGGVDSLSLLHALSQQPGVRLTVAHFDHGIRPDSTADRRLVADYAARYKLPFVFAEGSLGPDASEAAARKARYQFLHHVREVSGAQAIITAHHQDDALETAIMNLLRGTHRLGLGGIRSTQQLVRPLLTTSKQSIKQYATDNQLVWNEDSTNTDLRYRRNYIRHVLLPRLDEDARAQLLQLMLKSQAINDELEPLLVNQLHLQPALNQLDRRWFVGLEHMVARTVLHEWLRRNGLADVSRATIERAVVAAKTLKPNKYFPIQQGYRLEITANTLALRSLDR